MTVESQDKSVGKTTDEELALSLEGKEATEEKGKKVTLPPDHVERSEFGRKANERLEKMEGRMELILSRLETLDSLQVQPKRETNNDFPDVVTTAEDVRKINRLDKQNEIEEQKQYSQNYLKTFRTLGGREDPEFYKEVFSEMLKNFDIRHSDDPIMDARINFSEAKIAVLSRKLPQGKTNLRDKKSTIPTDLGIESRSSEITDEDISLDPLARDFAESVGMKKDSIREALRK